MTSMEGILAGAAGVALSRRRKALREITRLRGELVQRGHAATSRAGIVLPTFAADVMHGGIECSTSDRHYLVVLTGSSRFTAYAERLGAFVTASPIRARDVTAVIVATPRMRVDSAKVVPRIARAAIKGQGGI